MNLLQLSATMCFGELNELNCSALWEQTYYECVFIANSIGSEVDSQKQPQVRIFLKMAAEQHF